LSGKEQLHNHKAKGEAPMTEERTTRTRAEELCTNSETRERLIILRKVEIMLRLKANGYYKSWQDCRTKADELANQRLAIECSIVKPTICPRTKRPPEVSVTTRAELLAQWALLTPEQLAAQITLLDEGGEDQ
jgi:hypothetical protein